MKLVKILLIPVILAIVAIIGGYFWINSAMNSPVTHAKAGQYITIEKGTAPSQIISKLENEGIITNGTAVNLYLRMLGDASKLKAGEYQFNSPITPMQVLKELEKGEERTIQLTIPEGFTRFDIAKRIAEKFPQNPPMDDKAVLYLMDDTSLIKDIDPAAKNLEGYMYPSTYSFPKEGVTAQQVIKRLVEQFRKFWKPEWNEKARALGKTPHEIITIASLIETESKFDAERQLVASVIYNRLAKGIPLGIDQTAVYIAKMENRWDGTIHKSDLESASPYNTRKVAGLPPGPISSVTESSINAALNPAQTDYIFYVLNVEKNDGSHHFTASASEFEQKKAIYQKWLAEQRR